MPQLFKVQPRMEVEKTREQVQHQGVVQGGTMAVKSKEIDCRTSSVREHHNLVEVVCGHDAEREDRRVV